MISYYLQAHIRFKDGSEKSVETAIHTAEGFTIMMIDSKDHKDQGEISNIRSIKLSSTAKHVADVTSSTDDDKSAAKYPSAVKSYQKRIFKIDNGSGNDSCSVSSVSDSNNLTKVYSSASYQLFFVCCIESLVPVLSCIKSGSMGHIRYFLRDLTVIRRTLIVKTEQILLLIYNHVIKRRDSWRVVHDYRQLNKVIVRDISQVDLCRSIPTTLKRKKEKRPTSFLEIYARKEMGKKRKAPSEACSPILIWKKQIIDKGKWQIASDVTVEKRRNTHRISDLSHPSPQSAFDLFL
ncbi:hypothetical protein ACTFIW_010322 [Dictyostelium discoideum]